MYASRASEQYFPWMYSYGLEHQGNTPLKGRVGGKAEKSTEEKCNRNSNVAANQREAPLSLAQLIPT